MAVVLLVHEPPDVDSVVRHAVRFAQALETDLVFLRITARKGETTESRLPLAEASGPDEPALVTAVRGVIGELEELEPAVPDEDEGSDGEVEPERRIVHASFLHLQQEDLPEGVAKLMSRLEAELLVLPHRASDARDEQADQRQIFRRAPCATIWLRPGSEPLLDAPHTLVPAGGGPHAVTALRLGQNLARRASGGEGQATAVIVQERVGSYARQVGERVLGRIVDKACGKDRERVETRVVVRNSVLGGIDDALAETECDLVLVGASHHGLLRSRLRGTVPGRLLERTEGPAVGIVRSAIPLAGRVRAALEHLLRGHVPQLERADRVDIVERVQSNSHWDFDFVALVALSTTIASLGLLQDSSAVVIGAMLIAPLMTPLVGSGMAIVQGNLRLLRNAVRAVAFGFALAFVIGFATAALLPGAELTGQLIARGSPNVLDLIVAFVSGMAAAYATSRSNLSAALPGVAIAAALVPPTATAGIALALGAEEIAAGASVLFFTNIVAIVLGSATSLWAVGIRGQHEFRREERWVWGAMGGLVLLVIALATPLSVRLFDEVPGQAPPLELVRAIQDRIGRIEGARMLSVRHASESSEPLLEVRVRAASPPTPALADALSNIAARHLVEAPRVRIVTELSVDSEPRD